MAQDILLYIGRIRSFNRTDWQVYLLWVATISGLCLSTGAFVLAGFMLGVRFPAYVWNIPLGAALFTLAIAIDTIGHRTVYREEIARYEALVHHITIFSGVASVLALCLGYFWPGLMRIPALVFIGLSLVYSLLDEAMHWIRYATQQSDRVEMWSHYFILLGHLIMILAWWQWFDAAYPGVDDTLRALGL